MTDVYVNDATDQTNGTYHKNEKWKNWKLKIEKWKNWKIEKWKNENGSVMNKVMLNDLQ